jgi:hypothetical protein
MIADSTIADSTPLAVSVQKGEARSTRVATYAAVLAYGLALGWVVVSLFHPIAIW